MKVLVASHPSSLRHDTGPRHPERPERVGAVLDGIDGSGVEVERLESPAIDVPELHLVHDPDYVEMIRRLCEEGGGGLDADTYVSEDSWLAALTAAGGVSMLVDELESRSGQFGFAVSRPPGHHALTSRAMGFCLFNNVAVAAARLRERGKRVAILDWDVHHGNGTQEMVLSDPGVLYVSPHQANFYPLTGFPEDISAGAVGTTVNIPLPRGTMGDVYREAWSEIVLPVVEQFDPDWVLVSAGFDAHEDDFLAELELKASDFGALANGLADVTSPERTVFCLEGGYDLVALEESVAATLKGFSGSAEWSSPAGSSSESSWQALAHAKGLVSEHWVL